MHLLYAYTHYKRTFSRCSTTFRHMGRGRIRVVSLLWLVWIFPKMKVQDLTKTWPCTLLMQEFVVSVTLFVNQHEQDLKTVTWSACENKWCILFR